MKRFLRVLTCFFLATSLRIGAQEIAADPPWPAMDEVMRVLTREIPDLPQPPEGQTNVTAHLASLAPDVLLYPPAPEPKPPVIKTNIYGSNIGYIRIGSVEPPLFPALTNALHGLSRATRLAGLVLDLRFANGLDYAAAAQSAGLFTTTRPGELQLGDARFPIVPAGNTSPGPVVVLINNATRYAAEALAAAVRQVAKPAVAIGTNSAGVARAYRPVTFSTGRQVQVAGDSLRLPNGRSLPRSGLTPDLVIDVPPEDERLYFEDEFSRVADGRRLVAGPTGRLNEAELVRRRRGLRPTPTPASESGPSPVLDPALARGIDLLEGFQALRSASLGGESR